MELALLIPFLLLVECPKTERIYEVERVIQNVCVAVPRLRVGPLYTEECRVNAGEATLSRRVITVNRVI